MFAFGALRFTRPIRLYPLGQWRLEASTQVLFSVPAYLGKYRVSIF